MLINSWFELHFGQTQGCSHICVVTCGCSLFIMLSYLLERSPNPLGWWCLLSLMINNDPLVVFVTFSVLIFPPTQDFFLCTWHTRVTPNNARCCAFLLHIQWQTGKFVRHMNKAVQLQFPIQPGPVGLMTSFHWILLDQQLDSTLITSISVSFSFSGCWIISSICRLLLPVQPIY